MITPRFECTQTDQSVVVNLYCPSVRASDVEIHVDDTLVSVHVNPYFLRLNFPGALVEDDASSARYDPSSGYLTLTLTKAVPGCKFKDLDLLAKLLAPRGSQPTNVTPKIEVLSSAGDEELANLAQGLTLEDRELLQAAEHDWQALQAVPEPLDRLETTVQKQYGFLNLHSGYFTHVTHTENEVNELGADAETCPPAERRSRRLKHEDEKWDEQHYMADFAEDEYIQELIGWKRPTPSSAEFTDQEKLTMLNLPRKEYLADAAQIQGTYLTLVSILFAHAYDSRTTQDDPTPESAWTISSLIPAFSALDPPPYVSSDDDKDRLHAVMVTAYRRSLAFPLYRSFALADRCRTDVAEMLSAGKRHLTRCLLRVKDILDHSDVYYVYSKIWLDDFCVWIQAHASDKILTELGRRVGTLEIAKASIGWELDELEQAVRETQESDDQSSSSDLSEDDSGV